jgi:hypothetical protein
MIKNCPKCGASVVRGRRSEMMRTLSEKLKVYRYRCKSKECNWESVVIPNSSKAKLKKYLLILVGMIVLGLLLIFLFSFIP